MKDAFGADIAHVDGKVVVAVRGEVDLSTSQRLWETMQEAVASDHDVVLDLTETTFMDSTGLTILVRARRALVDDGRSITLRSPQRPVLRVLQMTKLDSILTIEGGPGPTD